MEVSRIVLLQDQFFQLSKEYPHVISYLFHSKNNEFFSQQVNLIFRKLNKEKQEFINFISSRDDYTYNQNTHILFNPITKKTLSLTFLEYEIIIEGNGDKSFIIDYLKCLNENFVMFD